MLRREFIVLFLATFASLLGLGIVIPILPLYALDLGAGGMWLGMIFAGFSISRTIAVAPIGRWSDRTSRKPFLVTGLCLAGVLGLAYALVDQLVWIVALRLVQGFASAMVLPIALAMGGDLTPPGKEGLYTGVFLVAMFGGFGVGPMLGGYVKDTWSLDAAFVISGSLSFAAALMVALALPRAAPHDDAGRVRHTPTPVIFFWRARTMRGFLLFRVVSSLGHGSLFSFLPVLGRANLGISSTSIGVVLTTELMLGMLLQVPCGRLADRVDRRMLMTLGIAIHSASLILVARSGTFTQLLIASLVLGIADAILMPTIGAITMELGREVGMGSSQGMFSMAQGAGMVGSGFLGGLLLNQFGVSSVYYSAAILGVLALTVFLAFSTLPLPERERRQLQEARDAATVTQADPSGANVADDRVWRA